MGKSREGVACHNSLHPPIMPESQSGFRFILCEKHAPVQTHFILKETCVLLAIGPMLSFLKGFWRSSLFAFSISRHNEKIYS